MSSYKLRLIQIILLLLVLFGQTVVRAVPKVELRYFYSPNCRYCQEIKEDYLPQIQKYYGEQITVSYFDITLVENFQTLLAVEKNLNRAINKTPPLIIIGQDALEGSQIIKRDLKRIIHKHLQLNERLVKPVKNDPKLLWHQFQNLTFLTILGAGLLDGINPCAFTTIIFLLSYLSFVGRKGKELLWTGVIFTIGVFAAYLLIGFGLLETLRNFRMIPFIGKILNWGMAGFALFLGGNHFCDYILIKQGKIREIKLQLGTFWKQKIHEVIRKQSKYPALTAAGFVLGFLVAVLEFPCTGQVYFPVVFMIQHVNPARALAVIYLVMYNIMFIIPLLVVFGLAYQGLTSEKLSRVMLNHAAGVKLFTAILFLGMAWLLIWL